MIVKAGKKLLTSLLVFALIFSAMPVSAFAAETATSILDGKIKVTYDSDTATVSGNTVKVTAEPEVSTGTFGDSYAATTEQLTLTNTSGSQAIVKFNYSALDNLDTLTINGTVCNGTGTWSGVVAKGGTVNITLSCGETAGNAELSIGNFSVTSDDSKTLTFAAAENGTITVNGKAPANVSATYAAGAAVTAVPASGYEFVAWVDGNNNILSTDASTTIHPVESCTVKAVFVSASSTQTYFKAAGKMFTDLNDAAEYAASSNIGTVIPMRNGTVAAGSYTIPAGVTLLIPFNAEEQGFKASPQCAGTDYTKPTAYRKLTVADGATITVNGDICVSAKHSSGTGTTKSGGSPTGYVGMMELKSGSNLILNNGANAYIWGFITGSGSMTAKSGSEVHENMQIADFRGGSITLKMITQGTKAFPFSQYYIQNVEAPLTIEAGASEHAYTTLTAEMPGFGTVTSSASVKFIGSSDSMFVLGEGATLTKTYLPDKDRLNMEVNGEFQLNSLAITAMGQSINSATFNLPINNNITIDIQSGTTTMNQDVVLQPGAEVKVAEDAEVKVASGHKLYVFDASDWGAYVHNNSKFLDVVYSPTRTYTRTDADVKDVYVDINGKLTIEGEAYTSTNGANITSSNGGGVINVLGAAGSETSTPQILTDGSVTSVSITPIKLKNSDGSYTATAGAAAGTSYIYDSGKWNTVEDVTITFDANGGTGSMDSQVIEKATIAAGKATTLQSNNSFIKKSGYTFAGWNTKADGSGIAYANNESVRIIRDTTLYAQWTPRQYTLTFRDSDGTVLTKVTQGYETKVEAPAEPVKEGYSFAGWTVNGEVVELPDTMPAANKVYTASWKLNQYTITFNTDGGSKIDSIIADYGAAVTAPENPTKDGYKFSHWTIDGEEADVPTTMPGKNVTMKAVWIGKQYTITFNTDGGSAVKAISTGFGSSIEAPEAPVKEGYTFTGWSPVLPETMPAENMTLTAQWEINEYTITFDTAGGGEVKSITADYGSSVIAPAAPTRTGYTFAGWDKAVPSKMPAGDMTITAQWTPNKYTITFDTDGGSSIAPITQNYGTDITAPENPTKEGYTFAGWDTEIPETIPAENMTVKAKWTINEYTVSFDTDGGSSVDSITQNYGTVITAPENPTKEGYTFAGWSPALPGKMPAEDVTLTAQWKLNQYTITFDTDGGSKVEAVTADYGADISDKTPAEPTKDGYTFAGWDTEMPETMPAGNMTITAQWKVNQYTVTFDSNGGSEVESVTQDYGTAVEEPEPELDGKVFVGWYTDSTFETPVLFPMTMPAEDITLVAKWSTGQEVNVQFRDTYTGLSETITGVSGQKQEAPEIADREGYTFTGWNPVYAGRLPESDQRYTAVWEINQYTITFVDEDGSEIGSVTADYATEITEHMLPEDPTRTGYTFTGWDTEIPETMPAGDMTVTAEWAINQYTITFDSNGGSEVKAITQDYGSEVTVPEDPTREGYTFAGWTIDGEEAAVPTVMAAENVMLTAQWTVNEYTITFVDEDGSVIKTVTADYGSEVTAPEDPEREGYTFAGWDEEIPETMPAGNMTITAKWTVNQYTITFVTDGGSEVKAITANYGSALTAPEDPSKEGYKFAGWDEEIPGTMPAKNMTITAKWTVNQYTITFLDEEGNVIDTAILNYSDKVTAPTVEEKTGYTFMGWDGDVPETMPAEDVTLTAQWKVNQYTITFDTAGGSEVDSITADYGAAVTAPKAEPTKTGYTFAGWDAEIPETMPAEDVTLTAQWTVNQYTVKFVDGETVLKEAKVDYGTAVAEPETKPTKTGYTFAGWNAEVPETMPAEDVTLTAQWTVNQYTVKFVDGETVLKEAKVDYGATVAEPETKPTKTGYTFAGWNAEVPETMPAKDVTLTAQWTVNQYTVKFVDGETVLKEAKVNYGAAVAALANPTKTGYTFAGWNAEVPETMPAKDVTLTAQWKVNQYTITFNSNGGSAVKAITQDYATAVTAPAAPLRTGYTFAGWDKEIPGLMPAENITLTAKWTVNQYTITFDTAGGSAVAPITADYGSAVTAPQAPTKDGYTFTGWNAEVPKTMPAENVKLTAQWRYSYTGWMNTSEGTQYFEDGKQPYAAEWATIGGQKYYFDGEGFVVKGVAAVAGKTYIFDNATGALKTVNGIYNDGNDTYLAENGTVVEYAGLKVIDGAYYYFGADNKAAKGTAEVTKTNGLIPAGTYKFDAEGKMIDVPQSIEGKKVTVAETVVYDGNAQTPAVTVAGLNDNQFEVSYKNNDKPGTATVVVTGKNGYFGTVEATFDIVLDVPVLKAENVASSGKIKLTWEAVPGADEYKIYRAESKNGTYTLAKTTSKLYYTNTSVKAGKTYYYKAVAVYSDNTAVNSAESQIIAKECTLARPVVTGSNVESTGKVKLTWKKITGADKYKVYRATSENGKYSLMTTTSKLYYTNTSATAGKTYYYKVVAVDTDNSAYNSTYSLVDKVTCKLARPDVKASNVESTGKIKLTWGKVSGADKYKVYRATSKNGKYTLKKTTTSRSYTDTSAVAGKTYYYKVVAVDASKSAANSAYSTVDSKTCKLARPNVTAKSSTKKQVKLSWKKVSGAKKYEVYRATSKNGTYKKITTTTKTSYTNKSLKSKKTYYYKVRAIGSKSAAKSAYSTVDSCKAK